MPSDTLNLHSPFAPRVALFTDTFDEVNGVARTFHRMVDEFARRGVRLHLFTYGRRDEMEPRNSVRVFRFAHRRSVGYYEQLRYELRENPTAVRTFDQQHASEPYDLVHVAAPGSLGWLGRRLAKRHGLPLIGTYHTSLAEYAAERAPKWLEWAARSVTWEWMRRFYAPCRAVLCPTRSICEELERNGFRNRLGVFSRGIDTSRFHPRAADEPGRLPTIAYVGRLAPEKNVRCLPTVLGGRGFRVRIVGDGPERGWLKQRLPEAEFTGYLQGDELAAAYREADLLVFPSRTDTFGNVVLEAMASGVVPIVLNAPGPRDFVTDQANAVVAADETAMRDAVDRLAQDHESRRKMAQSARAFAETQGWDAVFSRLIADYRRALAEP